jgi:hypothetical protein
MQYITCIIQVSNYYILIKFLLNSDIKLIYFTSRCLILPTNIIKRFAHILFTLLYSSIAIFMFAISLVPHTSVDPTHSIQLWPVITRWHKSVDGFNIVNSYGLFRRMTGVNGRPEIIIEGTNDLSNSWKEYHFMYKPGDITQSPKFIGNYFVHYFYTNILQFLFKIFNNVFLFYSSTSTTS